MSMLIAQAMSERASGRSGQPSITVLDECWSLLESPVLADCVVQLFRTARKRGASVWGISQTLEDFVGTKQRPKEHGAGILRNTSVKVIGQQPGDVSPLVEHLALNEVALSEIKRFSAPRKGRSAEVLLVLGEKSETTQTIRLVPTPIDYWIATTYPRERAYRAYFLGLDRNQNRSRIEVYRELGERFFDTVMDWNVRCTYANGLTMDFRTGPDSTTFTGSEGWVRISRRGVESEPASLVAGFPPPDRFPTMGRNHTRNFLDAIRGHVTPESPIDCAIRTDLISHLSNIAVRTGRKIRWDPRGEAIVGDAEATAMLDRPLREPWRL